MIGETPPSEAVNRASMAPFGWVFDAPMLGYVADHIGRRNVCAKTARKWVERFRRSGEEGLMDVSSRPHRLSQSTPQAVSDAIIAEIVEVGF